MPTYVASLLIGTVNHSPLPPDRSNCCRLDKCRSPIVLVATWYVDYVTRCALRLWRQVYPYAAEAKKSGRSRQKFTNRQVNQMWIRNGRVKFHLMDQQLSLQVLKKKLDPVCLCWNETNPTKWVFKPFKSNFNGSNGIDMMLSTVWWLLYMNNWDSDVAE